MMKSVIRLKSILVGVSLAAFSAVAFAQDRIEGRYVVQFKPGTTAAQRQGLRAKFVREIVPGNTYEVEITDRSTTDASMASARQRAEVAFVEPVVRRFKFFTPNDANFNLQWGLTKIQAPAAWDIQQGSPSIVVAVIDDGTDITHPDLVNKVVPGYDISDNDSNVMPGVGDDHGTHTAGIVGAETNNGIGVASIGNRIKIMPLKIFPNATSATSAAAIRYAADHGAKVISMSYGGSTATNTEQSAVNYAINKGCILVAAAGNDNAQIPFYPAALVGVVAVASSNPNDSKSSFSNYGNWITCAAPGINIYSTVPGNGYQYLSGTSMSCPMVSGLFGLVWSKNPAASAAAVRSAVLNNLDPVPGAWCPGRINALAAVSALPAPTETVCPVSAVALPLGNVAQGSNLAAMQNLDQSAYVAGSIRTVLGHAVVLDLSYAISGPTVNLTTARVVFNMGAVSPGLMQIWAKNTVGTYVYLGAVSTATVGDNGLSFSLPRTLTGYLQSGNQLDLRVRFMRTNSTQSNFTIGIDRTQVLLLQ